MRFLACLMAVALIGAGPATKPATQSDTESDLRHTIAAMQQRLASLQDENAQLRRRVADTDDKHGNRSLVLRAFELKRGMLEEEVIAAMGIEPNGQRRANYLNGKIVSWRLGKDTTVSGSRIEVDFEDGKLTSVRLLIHGLELNELR